MFLYKRNSIYYIWYRDDRGKKKKLSTGVKTKNDAIQVLRKFYESSHRGKVRPILLTGFVKDLFKYIRSNRTTGTLRIYESAFNHFIQYHQDIFLDHISSYHFRSV